MIGYESFIGNEEEKGKIFKDGDLGYAWVVDDLDIVLGGAKGGKS